MEKTARPKSRRLILLYRLRLAGVLEDLTLRQIGELLGVSRATVLGDLRDLDLAEAEFRQLMEAQPWKEWVAPKRLQNVDEEIEALKRLTRDGLVWLQNWVTPNSIRHR